MLQVIQTTKLETGRNRKAEKWGEINWEVTGKSAPFNSQSSSFVFCCFKRTKAINRIYLFIFIFQFRMKKPFQLGNSSSPLIVSDIIGASSLYLPACMFQESSIGCSLILHFFLLGKAYTCLRRTSQIPMRQEGQEQCLFFTFIR